MALTAGMIEAFVSWCAASDELAEARITARSRFFGYDEPGTVDYLPGVGEVQGRERRFLGWFCFSHRLVDQTQPAELAARALLSGRELELAQASIQKTRFVTAITSMVKPGRGLYLELEDEEFEVASRSLSQSLTKGDVLCAHLIPVGHGRWQVAPGWLVWPTRFGPGIRSELKKIQMEPLQLERFLQQRNKGAYREKREQNCPQDSTLKAAVKRMTKAAQSEGRNKLVKTVEEWEQLVLKYMKRNNNLGFARQVVQWVGVVTAPEELNQWIGLGMNIWNATPQPDRGGKNAYKLSHEEPHLHHEHP